LILINVSQETFTRPLANSLPSWPDPQPVPPWEWRKSRVLDR
jgi:hypothetical protein